MPNIIRVGGGSSGGSGGAIILDKTYVLQLQANVEETIDLGTAIDLDNTYLMLTSLGLPTSYYGMCKLSDITTSGAMYYISVTPNSNGIIKMVYTYDGYCPCTVRIISVNPNKAKSIQFGMATTQQYKSIINTSGGNSYIWYIPISSVKPEKCVTYLCENNNKDNGNIFGFIENDKLGCSYSSKRVSYLVVEQK